MIPEAAVEAAAQMLEMFYDFTPSLARQVAKSQLEAAAPHMLAEVWQSAYNQGVDDERTSQANPGIAGCFCHSWPCQCVIEPARQNPYRTTK